MLFFRVTCAYRDAIFKYISKKAFAFKDGVSVGLTESEEEH